MKIIVLFQNYEKAKMYLSRGMAAGQFGSSLQLIIVECLLQSVEQFPFVKTLKKMYNDFQDPNRRLIIISQILLYYTLIENNPEKILKYLKLYLDEDIEDTYKKHNLIVSESKINCFVLINSPWDAKIFREFIPLCFSS